MVTVLRGRQYDDGAPRPRDASPREHRNTKRELEAETKDIRPVTLMRGHVRKWSEPEG